MLDMLGKLTAMQEQLQNGKKELDNIKLESKSEGITITLSASKKIENISIDPAIVDADDIEQLEDLLLVAVNRALDKADAEAAKGMQKMASGLLPPGLNIPGLF